MHLPRFTRPSHRQSASQNPNASTTSSSTYKTPPSSTPVVANFPSHHLCIAAGIAIFHLASSRVVLCYHTRDRYYFLPKGRKDANETIETAACREGFEESGYRCRLLGTVMRHRQPIPEGRREEARFVTEALWCQMVPQDSKGQYILYWYVGETVTKEEEERIIKLMDGAGKEEERAGDPKSGKEVVHPQYIQPEPYPPALSISERIALDGEEFVPKRHEGTGVDAEEALYVSSLMPIEEAINKLRGSVMADVVKMGWEGVLKRKEWEDMEAKMAAED